MDKKLFILFAFFISTILCPQNRINYNNQELFLSGTNLAWLNFANDVGSNKTNLDEFGNILLSIHEHGGNSLRWWLHTNGTSTPEFDNNNIVIGPGTYTISDIKNVLDLAWEREIGVDLCLWSFDMLRSNLNSIVKNRNKLLLQDTTYLNAYIKNSLIPMVDSLKGHPATIAWEIFNEPEGMSNEFGWSDIDHVPMSDIQRFINLTSAAIHRTDPLAKVTNGCWSIQAMTDVPTTSLSKMIIGKEEATKEINEKYNFNLSTEEAVNHLSKLARLQNKNYYSDNALIEAGGDTSGTLDFYSVHYYDWAGTALSPFHHTANYWELNKPLIIAEFHMKNTLGVATEDLYKILFQTGYAGSLAWAWTDNAVTKQVDILAGIQNLWDNFRAAVDVIGIGGDWPTVSIISPNDNSQFVDTASVEIEIEASDNDGTIIMVEIFANDTLKIAELNEEPYKYLWQNIKPGNYKLTAIATDNNNHKRTSNEVHIVYGSPPFKRFEAEAVTIPGAGISIIGDPTASKGNYVEFRTTSGSVTWHINNHTTAGSYEIIFGYRLSFDSPKSQFINVNYSRVTELVFDGEVGKWLEKSLMVNLLEGENTIQLELSWGWMDLDYLAVPMSVDTSINEIEDLIYNYSLEQNYPNPFNHTTKIKYTIGNNDKVKLVIYDMLGRVVNILYEGYKSKGIYEVVFDANNLSSGIYFYSIETSSFSQRKKMIYLKWLNNILFMSNYKSF